MESKLGLMEYATVREIRGPLVIIENTRNIGYEELVEVIGPEGESRLGRVIEAAEEYAVVQVFEGTTGLSISDTRVRAVGRTLEVPVSIEMLGRVFDGVGNPIDGLPAPIPEDFWDVNGAPINP
ncbi:MAG: V-type ATP synthase subunit B, partial [Thermoprotei archaeon]